MLDPKLTSVLPRRILAFALDFGLVGLLSAVVARSQFETFPSDSSTWTAAQLNRIRELAGPLSRQQDIGDTKYVIPGGGLLLVLAIASVLALIVFVLLPASAGWSPGKRLLGLRTVDLGGELPTMSQYLTRAVVGLVDLLPVFIPGLLGFVLAGTSTHRQRLGDRLAGTLVIDARQTPAGGSAVDGERSSIDIEQRLDTTAQSPTTRPPTTRPPTTRPPTTEPSTAEPSTAEPSTTEPSVAENPPAPATSLDEAPAPVPTPEPSASATERTTGPAIDDPPPPRDSDPHPHPQPDLDLEPAAEIRTEPSVELDLVPEAESAEIAAIEAASTGIDVGFTAPAPTRRSTRSDLFSASASPADSFEGSATRAFSAGLGAELSDRKLPPAPMHRLDPADWDRPRAEPAPVWRPTNDRATPELTEPANAESETTVAEPATDLDSSLEVAASVPDGTANPNETDSPDETDTPPAELDPVWNEEWQAWLYWDHKRERWLRHDIENDRWIPLS